MTGVRALIAIGLCLAGPAPAALAQQAGAAPVAASPARLEIGVGGSLQGRASLGGGAAMLTPNLNGAPYALFDASAAFEQAPGGDLRVSVRVAPWLLAGASASYGSGDVVVSISGEQEGAATATLAGTRLRQTIIEARVDMLLLPLRVWGGRLTPYVTASGGILRHWPEDRAVVERGRVLGAGIGARLGFRGPRGSWRARSGVAAEVGGARVTDGFHWGERTRAVPVARAAVFTGWGR